MKTTIEIQQLSHGGPPGAKVAPARSSIWYRIDDGEWRRATDRSMLKTIIAIEEALEKS